MQNIEYLGISQEKQNIIKIVSMLSWFTNAHQPIAQINYLQKMQPF